MVSSTEDSRASINQLKAFQRHEPKALEGQIFRYVLEEEFYLVKMVIKSIGWLN